jgi:PTS system nitrogen regulatory IIA component
MKLTPFLGERSVIDSLASGDQPGVIVELAGRMQEVGHVPQEVDLVQILKNREELGSTGIGSGVAIPHVRLEGIASIHLVIGRSKEGVEFGAPDGLPVHIFFLMVAPQDGADDHLKALATISRLIKAPGLKAALLEAADGEEMRALIVREEARE